MLKPVRVRDYMATKLVTLRADAQILRAIHTLIENDIAGAPVMDEAGNLVGMLTERDCMRIALDAGYYSEYGGRVSEFMSSEVETVGPDDSILDAAKLFLEKRFHRYPVVENSELVGQISRRDVMRALGNLW